MTWLRTAYGPFTPGSRTLGWCASDPRSQTDAPLSFGDHLADRVAALGGSWSFIIACAVFFVFWAVINRILPGGGFDPYPYVFLNLILSMMAALQAPVIMMSQNRQALKDRVAAAVDFDVNVRAELQIAELSKKLDRIARAECRPRRRWRAYQTSVAAFHRPARTSRGLDAPLRRIVITASEEETYHARSTPLA